MNKDRPLTRLQERLIKKLGAYAFPFYFEVPPHCPASVSLQPAPGDTGKSFPVLSYPPLTLPFSRTLSPNLLCAEAGVHMLLNVPRHLLIASVII